jgi:hypothetical protein
MLAEPRVKHVWRLLVMTKEEIFNAKVGSLEMYGALFNIVAKEDGLDKAFKMHAAVGVPEGDKMGKAIKDYLAGKKINLTDLNKFMTSSMNSSGLSPEIKEGSKSLTLRFEKCPMYEGLQKAGLDHKTIQKMCAVMSKAEYNAINKYYPELEGKVKFRESPKGSCVEEFIIK